MMQWQWGRWCWFQDFGSADRSISSARRPFRSMTAGQFSRPWASDLYEVDSQPSLRHLQGTPGPVSIDEAQAALRVLDRRCHY
jgi:hypothetical protein